MPFILQNIFSALICGWDFCREQYQEEFWLTHGHRHVWALQLMCSQC